MTKFVMTKYSIVMIGLKIREMRMAKGLSTKELAQMIGMDASLMSRIEREERLPTENQVKEIAHSLGLPVDGLLADWLGDKVYGLLNEYPDLAGQVMQVMESRVEYLASAKMMLPGELSSDLQAKLEKIDALRAQWRGIKPAQGLQLNKLNEHTNVRYTFESNRIEGNTLTLQETFLVIHEGLTIAGKSVQEHLEAINHDEAIEFVCDLVENKLELTEYRLKQIHHLILKGIDRKNAGVYRGVPVRIGGSSHLPPEPFMIPKMMEDLFKFYEEEKRRMHPVLLAAEMHERFVTIHPFIDGNGRTGRLLMNLVLLKNGYTIAILKGNNEDRLRYYRALEAVQVDANPEPFYLLIADAVERSLTEHLAMV